MVSKGFQKELTESSEGFPDILQRPKGFYEFHGKQRKYLHSENVWYFRVDGLEGSTRRIDQRVYVHLFKTVRSRPILFAIWLLVNNPGEGVSRPPTFGSHPRHYGGEVGTLSVLAKPEPWPPPKGGVDLGLKISLFAMQIPIIF